MLHNVWFNLRSLQTGLAVLQLKEQFLEEAFAGSNLSTLKKFLMNFRVKCSDEKALLRK